VAESCCSSHSRRPVWKLLDTLWHVYEYPPGGSECRLSRCWSFTKTCRSIYLL